MSDIIQHLISGKRYKSGLQLLWNINRNLYVVYWIV